MARILSLKKMFLVFNIAVFVLITIYASKYTIKTKFISHKSLPNVYKSKNVSPGFIPDQYPCYYTKLQKIPNRTFSNQEKETRDCNPYKPDKNSCLGIIKYFGSPRDPPENAKCPERQYSDICWFGKENKLFCSANVCGGSTIVIGRRDLKLGHITTWTSIEPFSAEKAMAFVQKTLEEGDTYCFIRCGSILQALVIPPELFIKKTDKNKEKKININVLVLDSISRRHFYRMMKRSVNAFRDLLYNKSIPATALDFELFQSIGTSTFENIRGFFSGFFVDNKAYGNKQVEQPVIGMNVMYEHFKKQGYQTVFQEDLCWYDSWGTLMSNVKITGTSTPTEERWTKYKEAASRQHIDHFGITYFSCQVLKQYGKTNPYGDPYKVCLNGKFYSSYFLQYLSKFSEAVKNVENAAPFVSYLHVNTGHSETGKRISNIDKELANFIYKMSREPFTWTFLFGDHGHRRTEFALSTTSGDYERYNPMSFMIVPDKVAQILGQERMDALTTNQNRLVTVLDLHRAIMSINDQEKLDSKDPNVSGVLAEISRKRTCSDLPLMPLVKCQCVGSEEKYEDNAAKLQWVAEFALGKLNNDIQDQYSSGLEGKKVQGFGNCRRYVGISFRNIVQTNSGALTRMNLHAKANGLEQKEVFKVAVAIEDRRAIFKTFERQSTYNIHKVCADESVDIKVCSCNRSQPLNKFNPTRILTLEEMTALAKTPIFGREPQIKTLYENCLLQVTRNYFDVTVAVEVANACKDKTFNVRVTGEISNVFLSRPLPMNNVVHPNTYSFIYVSTKQSVTHFILRISIQASVA